MMKLSDSTQFDPNKRGFWSRVSADGKTGDVWVYEEIGAGWMGGLSAKDFADTVKGLGNVTTINVYVNSPGGSVFDGQSMYSVLNRHAARIVMHVDGLAASIASLLVMAGDEIRISAGGMVMIHPPWTVAAGNAENLRETAEVLDKIDSQLVNIYSERTGNTPELVTEWMRAETWMTADEAVENGFADEKTAELKVAACAFDLKAFGYRRIPAVPSVEPAAATVREPTLREQTIDRMNWMRANPRKD
jgi:ATP-dependent Clp protease protease subunit